MPQADLKARVVLKATISPSEDPAKVVDAIRKIVGEVGGDVAVGANSARLTMGDMMSLVRVRDQLRDRHVRSAARRQLLVGRKGNSASLMLNRQAAITGVVALCGSPEESPLGPIYLTIESDHLDEVTDWLTAYEEG
jgi:predicted RNA binding protein with dsRBD fold (UPF0201 family)